jgi:hypothetical protein
MDQWHPRDMRLGYNIDRLTWRSWYSARYRCTNPKATNWPKYGGRGIRFCDRWQDFANFLADMGPRPSRGHSIDRRDANGHYEPANCRLATDLEQARNKRNTAVIEWRGEIVTLADLSRANNIKRNLLAQRLKAVWSLERALIPPNSIRHRAAMGRFAAA